MPTTYRRSPRSTVAGFTEREFAFALAWELYAPGLGGWTVQRDEEEDGTPYLLVDPPLVYGDGFVLRRDAQGVSISSTLGVHRTATLREALLLVCPLATEALDAADRMAALPSGDHLIR